MAKKRSNGRMDEFREALGMTAGTGAVAGYDEFSLKRAVSTGMGIAALLVALAALIPALAPNHMVLGLFMVNGLHTAVHFLTAAVALYAAYTMDRSSTMIWRAAAVIYAAITLAGLIVGNGMILGMANNGNDVWLHGLITVIFAYLGWRRL